MICIVINSLGRGGAELSIMTLMQSLLARGRRVSLICLFPADVEYPEPADLQGHIVRLRASTFFQAVIRLRREVRSQQPRFLFSLMPQANLAAVMVGRWSQVPVLSSERTTPLAFYKPRAKLMLALLPHAMSRHAVFISEHALKLGLPLGLLAKRIRQRASVLHNPITGTVPSSQAAKARNERVDRLRTWSRQAAAPARPLELLVAGRLVPGKGVREFLDHAMPLMSRGAVRITLAGTGPLLPQLREWAHARGIDRHLVFKGFVENMQHAYEACDIVILNSASEGFGRVGFEAYLAGCLVLGTRANSFVAEVLPAAAAWHVVDALDNLDCKLHTMSSTAIDISGADIDEMRRKLSIEHHTDRFLQIARDGLQLDC